MAELDYKNLLKRVIESTPKKEVTDERFKIPKADVFYEGNTTVIRNFDKITDTINREAEIILKFLLGGLGTAGEIVGGSRAVFQGKIPTKNIQDKIKDYVDMFVICSECSRPDTHLVKQGRETLIRCDACGAFRSVKSRKKKVVSQPSASLKEGMTIELTIKDIGKKGDGIAYHDKYIVYVAGAVKGSMVKVKIEKISGTVAFAHIVEV